MDGNQDCNYFIILITLFRSTSEEQLIKIKEENVLVKLDGLKKNNAK